MNLTTKDIITYANGSPYRASILSQFAPKAAQAAPEKAGVTISIPLKTVSELNCRHHWAVKAARAKLQRATAAIFVSRLPRVRMPVSVRLVRTGGKRMDDEAVVACMKHVRDGIADVYGVDDGSDQWEWKYAQEPGGKVSLGVRVEIKPINSAKAQKEAK